jgi:hypothetical protein
MRAWGTVGPKGRMPAALLKTWPRHAKKPASNFREAFAGKLHNFRWGLTPPKKETKR